MLGAKRKRILWFVQANLFSEKKDEFELRLPPWVEALAKEVVAQKEVELSIAFQCDFTQTKKYSANSILFYPISLQLNKAFKKWYFKVTHQIGRADNYVRYKEVINDFDPDLIHVFGSEFQFAELVAYEKIPVLLHIQSIVNPYLHKWHAGGISQSDVLRFSRIKTLFKGSGVYHAYKRFQKQAIRETAVYQSCKYVSGRTGWDKGIAKLLAPSAKYFHCEELLREGFYKEVWKIRPTDTFKIITVINPNLYKGLETILKSAKLLKMYSKLSFEWHVIGFSSSNDLVQITEGSTKINSTEVNVMYSAPEDMLRLINTLLDSDLFVHTSHIENSSNAVCEAMLLGMPILCTDAGGSSTLIESGIEGILFPPGDSYVLASIVQEILMQKEKRTQLGKAAREKAQHRHNRKSVGDSILAIYDQVLTNV